MQDIEAWLTAAILLTLRVAPAFALAGPFALLRLPVTIRVLLALGLSIALVAGHPAQTLDVVKGGAGLPGLAAGELFVGLAIALSLQLAFAAILWAGQALDIQAGFGLATIADPATQAQMPLAGTVFAYAALFFTMGGAHDLLAVWMATLDMLPMGHGLLAGDMRALLTLIGSLFAAGMGLVGVVMLVLFLLDLAIAFMSRTLPQMNVLLLGFQVKSMAMLVTLPLAIALSGGLIVRMLRLALESAPRLLGQSVGIGG